MGWFLYVVSIVFVVIGAVLILYTDSFRTWLGSVLDKRSIRPLGVIPLIFGILMIISAAWSEVFWLILILGVLILAKGIYLVFGSREHIDRATAWWFGNASDRLHRFCGLILVILGATILSWVG